jgi:hypothetical protein
VDDGARDARQVYRLASWVTAARAIGGAITYLHWAISSVSLPMNTS